MLYVAIEGDDLAHREAVRKPDAGGVGPPVTVCGRRVLVRLPRTHVVRDGDGCHICLPLLAHPLAAVWDACRRLDANGNPDPYERHLLEVRT